MKNQENEEGNKERNEGYREKLSRRLFETYTLGNVDGRIVIDSFLLYFKTCLEESTRAILFASGEQTDKLIGEMRAQIDIIELIESSKWNNKENSDDRTNQSRQL